MRGKVLTDAERISGVQDHPRTCGEKPRASLITSVVAGSPPHMRGKEYNGAGSVVIFGITPAHAGKSRKQTSYSALVKDHPRTCGEKVILLRLNVGIAGSPPHMRGKAAHSTITMNEFRITPAHAGF